MDLIKITRIKSYLIPVTLTAVILIVYINHGRSSKLSCSSSYCSRSCPGICIVAVVENHCSGCCSGKGSVVAVVTVCRRAAGKPRPLRLWNCSVLVTTENLNTRNSTNIFWLATETLRRKTKATRTT